MGGVEGAVTKINEKRHIRNSLYPICGESG